jgi:hypothetical protein
MLPFSGSLVLHGRDVVFLFDLNAKPLAGPNLPKFSRSFEPSGAVVSHVSRPVL